MKKSPIKVIIRLRPTSNFAHQQLTIDEVTGQISIHTQRNQEQGIVNHQQNQWGFQFQKVLFNATQDIIYNLSSREIIGSALDGYSGCILCYGQTGAGKTFTMTGSQKDYKHRGIIPRTLSSLYQQINSRHEHHIKVSISYLELYNQTLVDLLNEQNTNQMSIQEDSKGYVQVKGLSKIPAENQQAALQLLFEGDNSRTITQHKLNRQSSRSHCVFTIHLEVRSRVQSSEKVVMSKINLVDLAGSERTKKTGSEGQTLIEAQFINRSLSFLEQVVVALSQKKRDHIPYRQNKLTYLLKDSIGGNSKTCMVANIWPQSSHLQETISTLKFASRMSTISNQISVDMELDPKLLLKKYQKDIKDLKQELAMHDTLASRGRINYEPYTPQQQHQQQIIAKKFLDGEIDNIDVQSLRQVHQLFFQFRNIYKATVKDIQNQSFIKKEQKQVQQEGQKQQKQGKKRVGQQENSFGFGAGKAVKDSKPTRQIQNLVNIPKDQFEEDQVEDQGLAESVVKNKIVNVDKNQAYQQFKGSAGQQINQSILKNIEDLKLKKQEIKAQSQQAQKKKQQIEELNSELKLKEEGKTQEQIAKNIIDEEQFQIIKQKKVLKKDYKLQVEKVKAQKNQIIQLDKNITSLKTSMIQKFQQWFFKRYGISVSDLENPLLNQTALEQEEPVVQRREQVDIDQDAVAYIQAKRKVQQLQRARKNDKIF